MPRFSGMTREEGRGQDSVFCFELYRCGPADGAVSPPAVAEALDVLEDRLSELDPRSPFLAVQQLDLHAAPERLRDRVVTGVADRAERGQQARGLRRAAASSADSAAGFSPRSMRSCFFQRYRHDSAIPRSFATSGTGRPERTRSSARCRNSGGYGLGIATTSPSNDHGQFLLLRLAEDKPVAVVAILFGERKAPRRHAAGPLGGGRRAASLYARLPPAKNRRPQPDAGESWIEAALQSPLYLDLPTVVSNSVFRAFLGENARPARGRRPGVGPALAGSAGRGRRRADVVEYWTGYCAGRGWSRRGRAALLEDVTDRALRSEFTPDDGAGGMVSSLRPFGDQSAQRPVITGSEM